MGGNFAAAIPDWQATRAALRNLDLTVHVSTKLNRSHLIHGRAGGDRCGRGQGNTWRSQDGLVANYDLIRDAIEAVFPIFHGYNARIRVPGGFHLTSTARERIWATASGKANFLVFEGCGEDPPRSDPDLLRLSTVRSHDQYNTTLYSMSDRY